VTRRLLAAAILAVLVPRLAFARPAVVRELGAVARAEPSRDAAAVQSFLEGDEVAVSDELRDGWRRVRLKDGTAAWIEDGALAFPEETAAARAATPVPAVLPPAAAEPRPSTEERPPPAAASPGADLRPRLYVKNVPDLAERVRSDESVAPRANALASRWRTSMALWIAGGVASGALLGVAATRDLPSSREPGLGSSIDTSGRLVVGAIVVSFATGLAGLLIHPRQEEVRRVASAWNATHPDDQVELALPRPAVLEE
jgi:hypothetical protein